LHTSSVDVCEALFVGADNGVDGVLVDGKLDFCVGMSSIEVGPQLMTTSVDTTKTVRKNLDFIVISFYPNFGTNHSCGSCEIT
jgi:hypothetical protein